MTTTTTDFKAKVETIIDDLKGVCASYGLGNDGNEFKIITQVFLYKFLNDKFAAEVKTIEPQLAAAEHWEDALKNYSKDEYELLLLQLSEGTARLQPEHLLSSLFHRQDEANFATLFDDTLQGIAKDNNDLFSVKTDSGSKVVLFDRLSAYISDTSKRDAFCKALINKLIGFSFEHIFAEKYDFFANIFEYLISDYNKDSGGKYAEYYTPHAVAHIMAQCLVDAPVSNVTCYDPSAGSGTLLMSLAHAIGEDKCTIYSQDISQKSSSLLRLNLILNNLVHSIQNIIQGNTIQHPYHRDEQGQLRKFDYIVSNPPFKLDFSDYSAELETKANRERFFAGIPNVPKKAKDKMAIYPLFIQHIMHCLSAKGKAAIVVPTGFITAQSGIEKAIRQRLVEQKMLAGVVSMPSNIFATTGTNVSILFLDVTNTAEVVLVDASNLGTTVKEGKNQKTLLSREEEQQIIDTFNSKTATDDFSVVVSYEEIAAKNYSLSAGQYFEVKIEYVDITKEEFEKQVSEYQKRLNDFFLESKSLEQNIQNMLTTLKYD
ncbi:class I SAM-dependent DNA methyltransferase [Lewinella sp. LCG006]|uniref:HsdM family class I SAM-dependent methyltransferase n=1 Tax=Lewinella sp. LCG006 TaxID=3231911 RepID=UPI00345F360F